MDIEQITNKIGLTQIPLIDPDMLYSLTTNGNSLLYSLSPDLINIIYDYAQETVTGFIDRKKINISDLNIQGSIGKHIMMNELDIKEQNIIYQLIIDYCGPYKEEKKPQLCKICGCEVVASMDGVYEGLDWLSNVKFIDKKKEKSCVLL